MPHLCAGRIFVVATFIISQAWSLGLASKVADASGHHELTRRKKDNPVSGSQAYEQLQISDGVAGDSLKKSVQVFLEPFFLKFDADFEIIPLDKLKAVSKDDLGKLKTLARAASDNEKPGFVKTIASTKDKKLKDALNVGMIANKVFKLVGQQAYLAIEFAQGNPARRKNLDDEKKKLKKNIEFDKKNKGKQMISYLHPNCFPFKSASECQGKKN
ncbi:uncharacterized protein MELLADRAFT_124309 [Melampsora larici-populina 98AG31]|uniref:Secreted protein n=1 Tax=Melampsora larici-populina (strain 98AG31 / pathotype 3-4-7) TaxID=747676 RepID=F4RD46_MELLP|nr:uncharacterized protein MELLADRAFT_124309 [Melampsora larici-populina 98AG31]EGG09877.1 secreted protein [Melampsora larici-populina 98AG31]